MTLTDRIMAMQELLISIQSSLDSFTQLTDEYYSVFESISESLSYMISAEIAQTEFFQTLAPRLADLAFIPQIFDGLKLIVAVLFIFFFILLFALICIYRR